jgi:hypothetical protein
VANNVAELNAEVELSNAANNNKVEDQEDACNNVVNNVAELNAEAELSNAVNNNNKY